MTVAEELAAFDIQQRDVISTRKILVTWHSDGNFSELRRKIASLGENGIAIFASETRIKCRK